MSAIALANFDDGDERQPDLSKMSLDDLKKSLAETMLLTATAFVRGARIVRELEERGEDLTALKLNMLPCLRKIAFGQLDPEAAVRFYHSPSLLAMVGGLPLPDQRRLAAGDPIPLALPGPTTTHRMADPIQMLPPQRRQVFAKDHIRSVEEQLLYLDEQSTRAKTTRTPEQIGQGRIDKERGGVMVNRTFCSLSDIKAWVRALQA